MLIACKVLIDFAAGAVPGQLTATVRFVTDLGAELGQLPPLAVAVGRSLTLGPVSLGVVSDAAVHPTVAATVGGLGGAKAAPAAALAR